MTAKKIGTHNGTFHCDEVLACFFLRQVPEYKVRSRPGNGMVAERFVHNCAKEPKQTNRTTGVNDSVRLQGLFWTSFLFKQTCALVTDYIVILHRVVLLYKRAATHMRHYSF